MHPGRETCRRARLRCAYCQNRRQTVLVAVKSMSNALENKKSSSLSGVLQTESGALSVSPLDPPYSAGLPVVTTNSFSVEVPELDETSVDFGLLVDVSGSYRCVGDGHPFSSLLTILQRAADSSSYRGRPDRARHELISKETPAISPSLASIQQPKVFFLFRTYSKR